MNRIEIKILPAKYEDDMDSQQIAIFIDDVNFLEIITKVEIENVKNGGEKGPAGEYIGLPYKSTSRKHFLGEEEFYYGENEDKTPIYICPCGEEGCWPFVTKIVCEEDKIIWSEFEQPHRNSENVENPWRYDVIENFVFDKKQYMLELTKLKE